MKSLKMFKKMNKFLVCLLLSAQVLPTIAHASEQNTSVEPQLAEMQTIDETPIVEETTEDVTPPPSVVEEETLPEEEGTNPIPEPEVPEPEPTPEVEVPEPQPEPETNVPEETVKPPVDETPVVEETAPPKEVVTPAESTVNQPVAQATNPASSQQNPIQSGPINIVATSSSEEFILAIGNLARKLGYDNDLYASVMIAQACLESSYGNSSLASAPYYNLFGIKGSHEGDSVLMGTSEEINQEMVSVQSYFRSYDSYEESLQDYVNLINDGITGNENIYANVQKTNAPTYADATKALTGVYATDSQYNQKLNAIIEAYNLTRFDTMPIERIEHTVQLGESLEDIAAEYDVRVEEIKEQNDFLANTNEIEVNQVIVIEKEVQFVSPLTADYTVSSNFGVRESEHHDGIDLAASANTPVYAAQSGIVEAVGFDNSAGNYVILKHEFGLYSSYFHLNEMNVKAGDEVAISEQIGLVGSTGNSTGPHLHFAISDAPWKSFYNPKDFLAIE